MISVQFKSNVWEVKNRLDKKFNRLARELNNLVYDYSEDIAKQMKLILIRRNNVWRGESGGLLGSIRARRIRGNSSAIYMKKSGIYLDSMKPHYVRLKKGRLIHKWALAKGNFGVKSLAVQQKSIFVRPSPFIDDAIISARRRLPDLVRKRLRSAGLSQIRPV